MKGNRTFWDWIFGGFSIGKLRIWLWKGEFWGLREPAKKADIEL